MHVPSKIIYKHSFRNSRSNRLEKEDKYMNEGTYDNWWKEIREMKNRINLLRVTRFAWIAHSIPSSNKWTSKSSAAWRLIKQAKNDTITNERWCTEHDNTEIILKEAKSIFKQIISKITILLTRT